MKLALAGKEPITEDIMMFWFRPEKPVDYIAGQYIELHLPHENPDDRKARRWFTLSSSPTEELLAITTRFSRKRASSFKNKLRSLKVGETVDILPPMGDFVLPKDDSLPIIFVAGGIGITPYRSMLKYLTDKGENRDIKLIYVIRSGDTTAFESIIDQSPAKYIKHEGELSVEELLNYLEGIATHTVYISGPEMMVERLQKGLVAAGIDRLQIRTDFFHNYD